MQRLVHTLEMPCGTSTTLQALFGAAFLSNVTPPSLSRKGVRRSLRRSRQATSRVGEAAVRSAIFYTDPIRFKRQRDAKRPAAAARHLSPPRHRFCPPSAAAPRGSADWPPLRLPSHALPGALIA